jgi:peptidoglycan hydrolase-like protein with peptidoglycan-binding domain
MQIIKETQKGKRINLLMNLISLTGSKSIRDFQAKNGLDVDGIFGINSYNALYKSLLSVTEINFAGHYYQEIAPKNQIVWHHSAGWDNARGMFDWWMNDKIWHVATAIGIDDKGDVFRGYDESFWGHHIGMSNLQNLARNRESVAVEVCNWGALTEKNGKLYSWANAEIPKAKAIELNYKGTKYYEIYTDAEIEALEMWTLLMALRFDIPLDYRHADMWSLSQNAINGVPGIYTHNSFIEWKSDVSPQPKLIEMAKRLIDFTK